MKLKDEIAKLRKFCHAEGPPPEWAHLGYILDFHDKAVAALRETEAITHSHGECGVACRTIARKVLALLDKEVE